MIGSACHRYFQENQFKDVLNPSRQALDLLSANDVMQYFVNHQPQIVILAAGVVGGIQYNKTFPADFINRNLAIQLNVFQASQHVNVEKVVFFASSCMYPRECSQPMNEDMLLTGIPEPTSMSYALSKLAGVQMCRAYNQQYGKEQYIALIPNSTYGPNDDFDPKTSHVISAIMRKMHEAKLSKTPSITLWGSGSPRREFVFSDDVASAVGHVLKQDKVPVPLNVGVGQDWSIKEIAEVIADVVGYEGDILWDRTKPDGAPQKLLDSRKMNDLGWKPRVDIREGLARTYDWFLEHSNTSVETTVSV